MIDLKPKRKRRVRMGYICANCHKVFGAKKYGAKFCSTRCRVAYHRKEKPKGEK